MPSNNDGNNYSKNKTIRSAKALGKGVRMFWRLVGGDVEFYDSDTNAKSHGVKLTADELAHLKAGGRLVVVHACGQEMHLSL